MRLRDALSGVLSESELSLLRAGFDVVGDIAILEIPRELSHREKLIGETLLKLLKNVRVVVAKAGGHKGKFRRQPMRFIAGDKRLVTIHRESGLRFALNVESCYFSPRLVSERIRLAKLIKPSERVLVVGSGVAPYPLVIAAHSGAQVVGVEPNPSAHVFALFNVFLNRLQSRVSVFCASASGIPDIGLFDRVIVAVPTEGSNLVRSVLPFLKKGGFLHVYDFAAEDNLASAGKSLQSVVDCNILNIAKAGQHAVRMYRVCVDAQLKN